MKAGKTNIDVRTRVRVTRIASDDPDDQLAVGATGEITHPFANSGRSAICGIWLDEQYHPKLGRFMSLLSGDEFEVIPDTDPE